MDKVLFTIILPTYNCEEYIIRTLDSIVEQDKRLYECIVVDGLSKDNTLGIVKEYSNKYSNVKYIAEKDEGVYDAMNKGIRVAAGEYLYFIGAGDTLYLDILKNLKDEINNEDLICGMSYHVGRKFYFMPPKKREDGIYLLFNHQAIFYKRKVFDIVGDYDSKYKIYADNVLNKKIIGNYKLTIKSTNIKIAKYLGNGISESESDASIKNDFAKIVIDSFGREYLKSLYIKKININKINSKKIIAWGTGGEYEKSSKIKEFDINYFIESNPKKNIYKDKVVKHRKELLKENKENILILVYSVVYYQEIRAWLEENGFAEFKNFILMNDDIINLLKEINLL
ncbi:PGL/p-HBAD biosynthesis glycosyltransferase [Clostridium puniceum]|uniref:PGL/p-HBAD biosynthesis glycosyltransferase n=1 Tax=Clostridium puniceum TaxID=29367 RepID=A0A1S8TJI7_9CLOT|nr:glycosyltransferase [Clostridium puniceum]OOM77960.1 PGL/p-HBAD biosynthesis glycosyltransferase [Clostridium puniceum]